MIEPIESFQKGGPFRFLSNFADFEGKDFSANLTNYSKILEPEYRMIEHKGLFFPTVEHYYQARKAEFIQGESSELILERMKKFALLPKQKILSSSQAKAAGKDLDKALKSQGVYGEFEAQKISIMREGLRQKFKPRN